MTGDGDLCGRGDGSDRAVVAGLVPAAGLGRRFGDRVPKQFLPLAGRSSLVWVVTRLRAAGVGPIVVAAAEQYLDRVRKELDGCDDVRTVVGGDTRQESVRRALRVCDCDDDDLVVVHDAARPAVSERDVRRTVDAAAECDAALLGRPMTDTVKRLVDGAVESTVDRSALLRAETPQVFRCRVLREAMRRAAEEGFTGTDEAGLVERFGTVSVAVVEATAPNPKLTRGSDIALVEALLEAS